MANGNLVLNIGRSEAERLTVRRDACWRRWAASWSGTAKRYTARAAVRSVRRSYCTWKPDENLLYLLVREWPQDGLLVLPGLASGVQYASPIGTRAKEDNLPIRQLGTWDWQIDVRSVPQGAYATVIKLRLDGALETNLTPRFISQMANTFWAYDGVIEGDGLRYDNGKRGHDGVTGWIAPSAAVQWTFRSEEEIPIHCRVIVTLSAARIRQGTF